MPSTALQTSVFLENRPGMLARVSGLLAREGVNLRAFTITESGDFGIIRLLADQPQKAHDTLKAHGFTVSQTTVSALCIPDSPGGLGRVAEALGKGGVNIEYAYVGACGEGGVLLVLKLDPQERGDALLREMERDSG